LANKQRAKFELVTHFYWCISRLHILLMSGSRVLKLSLSFGTFWHLQCYV
ncbi:hypothetical protein SOVF_170070, partial [Spinacia oleracea]